MTKKEIYKMIRDGKYWEAAEALTTGYSDKKIAGPQEVVALFSKYAFKRQEYFFTASLASDFSVIAIHEVAHGTLSSVPVHPREIFRQAILDNAHSIIVGHNHPSGDLSFSPEDDEITSNLKAAGEIIGIPVLDHVLITRKGALSYAEHSMEEKSA